MKKTLDKRIQSIYNGTMMKNIHTPLVKKCPMSSATTWQADYRLSSENNGFIGTVGVCV